MASIFTYNDDPPRVASPWSTAGRNTPTSTAQSSDSDSKPRARHGYIPGKDALTQPLARDAITRLSAEPETGPTEYKLHLLLRPRRTVSNAAASAPRGPSRGRSVSADDPFPHDSPPLSATNSSRQHRLEQLTTQLLWRLQQSSPFNTATSNNLVLPTLPEASTELRPPQRPARLVPGLEESKGALYEIGVADDGTFVGLTKDEMNESLNNLQAMASSLGCVMEVLRMVPINDLHSGSVGGDSEFDEFRSDQLNLKEGVLYVAEAYIKPLLEQSPGLASSQPRDDHLVHDLESLSMPSAAIKDQLRVTLTGATTCGKSSLLGTLSTSTLDNGRGLSRLNLLKHRHEIASGVTSSVAQELVGYDSATVEPGVESAVNVVNYATKGVSSWNDIHAASESGRLAFLSDSAGHPRYRRTTVRGLVGCAPHWTMLCMAACESSDAPTLSAAMAADTDGRSFPGASAHLSMAHLDLCLKLQLPLVVVITKLDAVSKTTIRQMLSTLLTTLKAAGRKPIMVSNDTRLVADGDLQQVSGTDAAEIERIVDAMGGDAHAHVPIVFTSAVKGTGIGKIHALLRYLPIPRAVEAVWGEEEDAEDRPATLFHVDNVFDLDLAKTPGTTQVSAATARGFIVSGRLSRGAVSVGQTLELGPFSVIANPSSEEPDASHPNSRDAFLTPRSFTDALAKVTSPAQGRVLPAEQEWQTVNVVSLRNLRLPVHVLQSDRIGTIGIVPVRGDLQLQLRRGMILTERACSVTQTLTAVFDAAEANSITVGSRVVIYSSTIRSSAKIMAVALEEGDPEHDQGTDGGLRRQSSAEDLTFGMDQEDEEHDLTGSAVPQKSTGECILVTLQLDSFREFIEEETKILLMPGGGPGLRTGDRGTKGLAGLEGFVGRVVDTFG